MVPLVSYSIVNMQLARPRLIREVCHAIEAFPAGYVARRT